MNEDQQKEMNMKRLENFGSTLYAVIFERYKIFPQISTLSAALVGLIAQTSNLVKEKNLALISFIILLTLIPLSIFGLLYQLGSDAENLSEKIKNIFQPVKTQTKINDFMNIFPWIILFFFSVSIILIILSFFNLN